MSDQDTSVLTLKEKRIQSLFKLATFFKGVHSIVEIIGGMLLLLVSPSAIAHFVGWLTQEELLEDPNDIVSNFILHLGSNLSLSTTIFGGLYLLAHGLIKVILVIALLKNKLWAYSWSLAVLGLFVLYQVYRFNLTHSLGLLALSFFDFIVMWLIWQEYKIVRTHSRIK